MKRSCGFTLIELLAATALTALLMVGILNVVARLSADHLRQPSEDVVDAITLLVERDLHLAREVRTGEGFVEMRGYGHLDEESLTLSHLPTLVRYELQTLNDRPWLVRIQTDLDQLTNERPFTELVEAGVQSIEVQFHPQAPSDVGTPESAEESPLARSTPFQPNMYSSEPHDWTALDGEAIVRIIRDVSTEEGDE